MLDKEVQFRAHAYQLIDQVVRHMNNETIGELRIKIDDNGCVSFFVLASDGLSYLSENPADPVTNNE